MPAFVPTDLKLCVGEERNSRGREQSSEKGSKQGQPDGNRPAPTHQRWERSVEALTVKRSQKQIPAWHTVGLDLNLPVAKGASSMSGHKMEYSMQINL